MALEEDEPLVDRMTMLPVGQYEDGSLTFAWPGFLKEAWEGGQRSFLDAARAPVPDAPVGTKWSSNVDALNAASIAPVAGVAGRAAGMAKRLPESVYETGHPMTARAYRGAGNATVPTREYWSSSSPEVANSYTGVSMMKERDYQVAIPQRFEAPNVSPVKMEFQNPLVVDGGDSLLKDWSSIPFEGSYLNSDALAEIASKRGHDGLVLRNIRDAMWDDVPIATSYAALRPGTVRSATTGETLFANDANASLPVLLTHSSEDTSMDNFNAAEAAKRWAQYFAGLGLLPPGAIVGGTLGGTPGALIGGTVPSAALMVNSDQPNIRDVWADQLRMKLQGN